MKPFSRIAGVLAIAILFGSGGYFLGKNQSIVSPSAAAAPPAKPAAAGKGRTTIRTIDPSLLRSSLDAEKNPLARFKLAMQNLDAWVAKNPADALAWLASQQPSERRDEIMRMALNQFSEIDPKGAAGWATANLTGADLNNTLIAIAENWALQNGGEAAAFFLALPPTQERDAAIENIFFSWASNEPAAALEFLKMHPELGDLSPTLRRAALAGWAKTDPEGAVNASLAISRSNNDVGQFANTLANWATMDLEASSQWLLANLPPGNERTAAAVELANIFASQSPDAGIAWLQKLAAGAERDAAASTFAAAWSRSSPADAAKWTAAGSNNISLAAMAEISRNFLLKDASAFQTWRAALPEGPLKQQSGQVTGVSAGE